MKKISNSLKQSRWLLAFATAVIFIGLSIFFVKPYTQAFIPIYEELIKFVYTRFDQVSVFLGQNKTEAVIKIAINNSQAITVNDKTLPANLQASAHTLLGHVTQHLIFFGLCLSIGLSKITVRPIRLFSGTLLALILLELSDIPWVLIGSIEGLVLQHTEPALLHSSLLVMWSEILLNGGRMGIAIALALFVLTFSQKETNTAHS